MRSSNDLSEGGVLPGHLLSSLRGHFGQNIREEVIRYCLSKIFVSVIVVAEESLLIV